VKLLILILDSISFGLIILNLEMQECMMKYQILGKSYIKGDKYIKENRMFNKLIYHLLKFEINAMEFFDKALIWIMLNVHNKPEDEILSKNGKWAEKLYVLKDKTEWYSQRYGKLYSRCLDLKKIIYGDKKNI